ncbi:MAG TPA: pyridoxal phosphate-dependent aminotransferase [Syntrophomonas sp.]|jgi:aspartate aminotransferase|nr:pyridoxal phosphate-dependent aminotransferase [Syntrophomonas sp.]
MISEQIKTDLHNASWIRAMFEEGERLRAIYGAEKVFDFSLGNPDYEPPARVGDTLKKLVVDETPGLHRYTSNAGYADVREKIAAGLARESGLPLGTQHIIMTCGAAGGLNVVLKTILNPGNEVILLAPYFVEYHFYVNNHGGKAAVVPTGDDFLPDPDLLARSITPQTRAIIINSPNNPTGVVYSQQALQAMAAVINAKEQEYGTEILAISDEPYYKLVYEGARVTNLMTIFKNAAIVNSFSKSLALPGERIGYIAVSPNIEAVELMTDGLVFANRTLGYVNAPSIFQKVVAECLDEGPDTDEYQRRRDTLYNHITGLGFTCVKPQGAFYLFPKSPEPDDVTFVQKALEYNLLLVPGRGFAMPGFFRMAYCVDIKTIERALPAFDKLAQHYF